MENMVNKLRIVKLKNPKDYFKKNAAGNVTNATEAWGKTFTNLALASVFEVQVNPDQMKRDFVLYQRCSEDYNASESSLQSAGAGPEDLNLKFILDGTGALQQTSFLPVPTDVAGLAFSGLSALGIDAQVAYVATKVAQLQAVVYDYLDETHNPPLLTVNWGKMVFIGKMTTLSVNYTLFAPSGLPLRAEVSLALKSHSLGPAASKVLSFLSPDLSRRRIVRGSDTILTLCESVFESEKYYLEVAKANGLTNFRKIDSGVELDFPPIDKRRVV